MKTTALCIALAIASLVTGGYLAGLLGIVLASPLVGALVARGLIDGFSTGYGAIRAHAYANVQGRYYAYKSIPIAVAEDGRGHRWLRVRDIRRVLPYLPRDSALRSIEPQRTHAYSEGNNMHIRADALLDWLAKSQSSESIRFKLWIQRTVHFPSCAALRDRENVAQSITKVAD